LFWDQGFFDPIIVPGRKLPLVTLRDAAQHIIKLPRTRAAAPQFIGVFDGQWRGEGMKDKKRQLLWHGRPENLISFPNGILDLRDNRLHPPDPSFFTMAALGFDYVAKAPEPVNWKQFLREIAACLHPAGGGV
jgi:hypothetical protein